MIALALAALALSSQGPSAQSRREAVATILVSNRDSAADRAVARAQSMGGWMDQRDDDGVVVRIPSDSMETFARWSVGLGRRVDYSSSVVDLAPEIADLNVSIASRDTLLRAYLELVDSARTTSQLRDVERLGAGLAVEIGKLRAQLGHDLHLARWATFNLRLGSLGGAPSTEPRPSPFRWINGLGLDLPRGYEP